MAVALWVVVVLSLLAADARWVRVAQREHYYAGRPLVVARIWCRARSENAVLVVVAVALAVLGLWWRPASFVGALAAAVWPLGLSVRSTSSALAWTPRLRRLAICLGLVELVLALVCWVVLPPLAALLPALVPALTALALAAVTPIERRLSSTFVVAARRRLAEVRPTVVGITGSYGKTSTKGYVAHLVSGSHSVVASPAPSSCPAYSR